MQNPQTKLQQKREGGLSANPFLCESWKLQFKKIAGKVGTKDLPIAEPMWRPPDHGDPLYLEQSYLERFKTSVLSSNTVDF